MYKKILLFFILPSFLYPLSSDPKEIEKRILEYRTKEVTLIIKDTKGQPVKEREVLIEQVSHAFLFGCNFFHWDSTFPANSEEEKVYRQRFVDVFNYATLPFYWGYYEPAEGKTREERLKRMSAWCKERGILTKAHPLIWHEVVPNWANFSSNTTENMLEARVKDIMNKFNGLIDFYDVINESIASPKFDNCVGKWIKKIGPVEAVREAISWAREANPKAFLLVNDYDVSDAYVNQIAVLKELGFAPDAIGIQSHMHKGVWSTTYLDGILSSFSRLNIPIHFTEMTILSGRLKTDDDWNSYHPGWNSTPEGEKKQAEDVVRIYSFLFSHPAVEAITWWDLSDYDAWQGAPAGLLRKDLSPKPAYEELKKLIKGKWWTGPISLKTDIDGRITFRGFMGKYKISIDGKTIDLILDKKSQKEIELKIKRQ